MRLAERKGEVSDTSCAAAPILRGEHMSQDEWEEQAAQAMSEANRIGRQVLASDGDEPSPLLLADWIEATARGFQAIIEDAPPGVDPEFKRKFMAVTETLMEAGEQLREPE